MLHQTQTLEADDSAAIDALAAAVETQRDAFLADPYPSLATRRERLATVVAMLTEYRPRLAEALRADFGSHAALATDIVELLGPLGRAAFVSEQLEEWMEPEPRFADPALVGDGDAWISYEPKGVIGNIVPWNFPVDIAIGPLVDALAAGNRCMIKPSDFTPATAEVIAEMIAEHFDPDLASVAVGGVELAQAFSATRWDHLIFTGSPSVGRQVMLAAAANLVPVTLELGGKCPVVIDEGSVTEENVRNIIGAKLVKNGQMCISADYCLVPRSEVDRFVELAQAHVRDAATGYARSEDCTGIISGRHLDRLVGLLDDARDAGATLVALGDDDPIDAETRRMPLTAVIDPPAEVGVMTEEIFGPILPIKPYDSLDEAVALVNAGERPLGLYVFSDSREVADRVLEQTSSGGACINAVAIQGALPSLGFGGIGNSGMGRHHGLDGFRELSNPRGIFRRGSGDLLDAFAPPYGDIAAAVSGAIFPET